MRALILILLLSGCASHNQGSYEVHMIVKRGDNHATGYVKIDGIRHDLNIQVVTED